MVVGEVGDDVDFLVLGGGPGGYAAAARAAQLGRRVTLVDERGPDGLGGTCLHVGCIPSKALIELAARAHGARSFAMAGLDTGDLSVDMKRFQSWRSEIVSGLTGGVARLLSGLDVSVVQGRGRFSSRGRVAVTHDDGEVTFMEFRSAVIATGSRPSQLTALPVDGTRVLDSTGALALEELPDSMVVVGGGYIGIELGTAFAKLGVDVSVVEATGQILPTLPLEIVRPVLRSLQALGTKILTNTVVEAAGEKTVTLRGPDGTSEVAADVVVVAVGRTPNTDQLGLSAVGITPDERGFIPVDAAQLATGNIAAIGDVVAGPALAHKATAEAAVAAEALCGRRSVFDAVVPAVVFSDPEIATVGMTATEAAATGIDVAVAHFPLAASGRAATAGARNGLSQIVVDTADDTVVGVHIAAPHASELAAAAALAIEMGATATDLALTIHPHPTISEGVHEAARDLADMPLHFSGRARKKEQA